MCVYCSKAFDIDMSPLSFGAEYLYHFITERFEGTSAPVQEQCLEWLQVSAAGVLWHCFTDNCMLSGFSIKQINMHIHCR